MTFDEWVDDEDTQRACLYRHIRAGHIENVGDGQFALSEAGVRYAEGLALDLGRDLYSYPDPSAAAMAIVMIQDWKE